MSELQAGMLALVVGYSRFPDNLGRVVTLDKFVTNGTPAEGGGRYDGRGSWLIRAENLTASKNDKPMKADFAYAAPNHLLPLPPMADPLDVTHKEELHA